MLNSALIATTAPVNTACNNSNRFIKYIPALNEITNSLNASLVFMKLYSSREYNLSKGINKLRYTDKDLANDTGLTIRQLAIVKKKLIEAALISIKVTGNKQNKKTEYILNDDKVNLKDLKFSKFIKYMPWMKPLCGTIVAALVFMKINSSCEYHKGKGFPEFYHSDKNLQSELGINRWQLESAKKLLVEKGLISCRVRGENFNRKTYYDSHIDKLNELALVKYKTNMWYTTKPTCGIRQNLHTNKNIILDNNIRHKEIPPVDNLQRRSDIPIPKPNPIVFFKSRMAESTPNSENKTGTVIKLHEAGGVTWNMAYAIGNIFTESDMLNVLESARSARGRFTNSETSYIMGAFKKTALERGYISAEEEFGKLLARSGAFKTITQSQNKANTDAIYPNETQGSCLW